MFQGSTNSVSDAIFSNILSETYTGQIYNQSQGGSFPFYGNIAANNSVNKWQIIAMASAATGGQEQSPIALILKPPQEEALATSFAGYLQKEVSSPSTYMQSVLDASSDYFKEIAEKSSDEIEQTVKAAQSWIMRTPAVTEVLDSPTMNVLKSEAESFADMYAKAWLIQFTATMLRYGATGVGIGIGAYQANKEVNEAVPANKVEVGIQGWGGLFVGTISGIGIGAYTKSVEPAIFTDIVVTSEWKNLVNSYFQADNSSSQNNSMKPNY